MKPGIADQASTLLAAAGSLPAELAEGSPSMLSRLGILVIEEQDYSDMDNLVQALQGIRKP